jgi:hypothetical protein
LSVFVAVGAALLPPAAESAFRSYVGNIAPVLAVGLAALAGCFAFGILRANEQLKIFGRENYPQGLIRADLYATLFAMPVVLADLIFRYPQNINVPLPDALLFYPTIAFIAEIAFHVLPYALLLFAAERLLRKAPSRNVLWTCVVLAAALEPAFQSAFASSEGEFSSAEVYTVPQVFAIGIVQLYLFRRYDFFTTYVFRVVYYLHWHILWGYLRLQLLF